MIEQAQWMETDIREVEKVDVGRVECRARLAVPRSLGHHDHPHEAVLP